MSNPAADTGAPNCWQCHHFAVSWDPNFPYTCRLMGFKSRITPALEVLRADGTRCRGFLPKPGKADPAVSDNAAPAPAASSLYSTFSKLA